MTYQVVLPLLELPLLDEPFDVLDVPVDPAAEDVVVAEVTPLFAAQKFVYHVSIACKSAVAEQLAVPQTWLTPAVPVVNGVSRASEQKQLSLTVVVAGGEHAP